MTDNKVIPLNTPAEDALQSVLKAGAQQLLSKAVETELESLLAQYDSLIVNGK